MSYFPPTKKLKRLLSSNINEVIGAVLNPLFIIFLQKDFARTKSTKSAKAQKHEDGTKKAIKRYKRTKIKTALKKDLRGKSHLFAYLRFCACEEKQIKKSLQ